MKVGEILNLEGITRAGKNKIREHGGAWKILKIESPPCMSMKPSVLIESVLDGNLRWILVENDQHLTQGIVDENQTGNV